MPQVTLPVTLHRLAKMTSNPFISTVNSDPTQPHRIFQARPSADPRPICLPELWNPNQSIFRPWGRDKDHVCGAPRAPHRGWCVSHFIHTFHHAWYKLSRGCHSRRTSSSSLCLTWSTNVLSPCPWHLRVDTRYSTVYESLRRSWHSQQSSFQSSPSSYSHTSKSSLINSFYLTLVQTKDTERTETGSGTETSSDYWECIGITGVSRETVHEMGEGIWWVISGTIRVE